MEQPRNLKTFVSKFIEQRAVQNFPQLYIVDKQTGPYRTIQEAIDAAEPKSLIKISQGFYEQNLVISKPLRLEPKDAMHQQKRDRIGVVVLASEGIGLRIRMAQFEQECQLSGIKLSHSGNSSNFLKKQLIQHQHLLAFKPNEETHELESQFVNYTTPDNMQSIILLLQRGKAKIDNCIFSLNYLVKSCSSVIPAVWIEKDGAITMSNCEIKGHETKETIGIVCRMGSILLQNSTINHHRAGGVLIWGLRDNNSRIIKSIIEDNQQVGVHVVGQYYKLKIISNNIRRNGVGIKVGLACQPQISRNIINENKEGIQINSAFPNISLNKIQKNVGNGIICRSYKKFMCKAIIRRNVAICGNGLNGIVIQGQNNRSQLIENHLIGFNIEAGIKVQSKAFPTINGNKIYKNYKQGLLIVEDSNAIIQRNDITHNIDCNVAIGGVNSHHSLLAENIIADSPNTGLHIIRSGRLKVVRNDINRNQDGIIICGGRPQLRRNYVSENRNNGLVCEESANPYLIDNFIVRNSSVGLLIRGNSCSQNAVIHSNILSSNEIDVALQQSNHKLITDLSYSNTVQGDIYQPQNVPCEIM